MPAPSYEHGSSTTSLLGETIGGCLERIAADHPDSAAIVSCAQDVRLSYGELAAWRRRDRHFDEQ